MLEELGFVSRTKVFEGIMFLKVSLIPLVLVLLSQ